MSKDLSPYKVSWLLIVPVKGKPTKKDAQTAGLIAAGTKMYFSKTENVILTHQPNKEAAISKAEKLKGKLSKKYIAYVCSDKQFGLSSKDKPDVVISSLVGGVKLTTKQKQDAIKI